MSLSSGSKKAKQAITKKQRAEIASCLAHSSSLKTGALTFPADYTARHPRREQLTLPNLYAHPSPNIKKDDQWEGGGVTQGKCEMHEEFYLKP
jgi:hypothetical protein